MLWPRSAAKRSRDRGARDVVIADDFNLVVGGQLDRGREEKEARAEIGSRDDADKRGADDQSSGGRRPAAAAKFAAADFDRLLAAEVATLFVGQCFVRVKFRFAGHGSLSQLHHALVHKMTSVSSSTPKAWRTRSRTCAISASMSAQRALAGVDKKIGVAIADAGVADGEALQAQLVDHAAGGSARRILEDAAGAFLIERLAGSALFVADTNSLKNLAYGLEGSSSFTASIISSGAKEV